MTQTGTLPNETLSSWSAGSIWRALVTDPSRLMAALRDRELPRSALFAVMGLNWLAVALLFGATSVLHYPHIWGTLTPDQLMARFLFISGTMALLYLPILLVVWLVLQKLSCWFFSVVVPVKTLAKVSAFSLVYWAIALLLSLPLVWLIDQAPASTEIGLFTLNMAALVSALGLFRALYQQYATLSTGRAWWLAVCPIVLALVTGLAIVLLTVAAMLPQFQSHH